MTNVTVVVGAGSIGQAIARRVSSGKHVLLADLRLPNADAAAKVLSEAGFEVSTTPDEVGALGAFLMGPDGAFITGSDFLMDGGVTSAYWYGKPAPQ